MDGIHESRNLYECSVTRWARWSEEGKGVIETDRHSVSTSGSCVTFSAKSKDVEHRRANE